MSDTTTKPPEAGAADARPALPPAPAPPAGILRHTFRLSALQRQALAVTPAAVCGTLAARWPATTPETPWLAAWVVYALVYLALVGHMMWHADAQHTRRRAQRNDPGAAALAVVVTVATLASLFAVALAVDTARSLHGALRAAHLGLATLSLACGWLLIQTAFTLHYARLYWRPPPGGDAPARGLSFPGTPEPDYLDFLYYAAVIGMTSQVSDVAVGGRHLRRVTLIHGMLSFAFNLVVLAIAVNVLASALA